MECLNVQGFNYHLPDNSHDDRHHRQAIRTCRYCIRDESAGIKVSRQTTSVDSDFKKLMNQKPELDGAKYPLAFEDPVTRSSSLGQAVANSSAFGSIDGNSRQLPRRYPHDSMSDLVLDREAHRMSKKSAPALARRSGLSTPNLANYTLEDCTYPSLAREKMKETYAAPTGVVMALAVAALGIGTAVKKGGLFINRTQNPTKVCIRCYGSGVERCDICNGRGRIEWEGKLKHFDPCPLCFGTRTRKCTACEGKRSGNISSLPSQRQWNSTSYRGK